MTRRTTTGMLAAFALTGAVHCGTSDRPRPADGTSNAVGVTTPTDPLGNTDGVPTGPLGVHTIVALDEANNLLRFSSDTPDRVDARVPLTGFGPAEKIQGIDFRPANGRLYALGGGSHVYTVDLSNGALAFIGGFAPALDPFAATFGFDFNPVADKIRVHADTAQNLRLNPDTGAHVPMGAGPNGADGTLAFVADDVNAGRTPHVVASAYTNSVAPTPATTTLYAIDSTLNILIKFDNANAGTARTVGSLGLEIDDVGGFDIFGGTNGGADAGASVNVALEAFAILKVNGRSTLFRVDLGTGRALYVGEVAATNIIGMAIAP